MIGTRDSGTGIINNETYIGRIVWNKRSFLKNPDTGKRVGRRNPRKDWVIVEVPELRIIDQALWNKVKSRQDKLTKRGAVHAMRRPKALFAYLLKCGCCDGGFSKISSKRYGCSSARKKGTCDNRITIDQTKLEETILSTLQSQLMRPELLAKFCDAYTHQLKQLHKNHSADTEQAKNKLSKLDSEKAKLIEAIKQGIPASEIKSEFTRIAKQRAQAEQLLHNQNKPPISLHPDMAQRYQMEVSALRDSLNNEENRHEASELIRTLIDKVVLVPDASTKKLRMNLYGDLAGILSISSGRELKQEDMLTQAFFEHTSSASASVILDEQETNNARAVAEERRVSGLQGVSINAILLYWWRSKPEYQTI